MRIHPGKPTQPKFIAITVGLLFAALGIFTLVNSMAATPASSKEAETGTVTTGAYKPADSTASGGQSVRFGSLLSSVTADTKQIGLLTGPDSINQTRNVNLCGTDLGIMFAWQNKTFFAFGDTQRCSGGVPANALAYSSTTSFANGVKFDGWAMDGSQTKEIIPKNSGAITAIPTGAVGVNNDAYIYYMNVTDWHPPGPAKWVCSGSSLASANASNIGAWTKRPSVSWGAGNFNMTAVLQQENTLYIWGTPCGRMGAARLMKVDTGSVLNKSAYQYYTGLAGDGSPQWSANESSAIPVASAPVSELSVMYNKWLGKYMMTYLDENKAAIVLREADTPWGPWSSSITLTTAKSYAQLYGAFLNPAYVENDGQTFYWVMSMFGPYQSYLMKTTLTKR